MVCKLDSGEIVIISNIRDLKDYIDEDLFEFIEDTDIYSLKEFIGEIKESLIFMKDNINNSKRLNKSKIIRELNNILAEINYYDN